LRPVNIVAVWYSNNIEQAYLDLIKTLAHFNGSFSLQEELVIPSLHHFVYGRKGCLFRRGTDRTVGTRNS
jgi:hypothetical protein